MHSRESRIKLEFYVTFEGKTGLKCFYSYGPRVKWLVLRATSPPQCIAIVLLQCYIDMSIDDLFELLIKGCDTSPSWDPGLLESVVSARKSGSYAANPAWLTPLHKRHHCTVLCCQRGRSNFRRSASSGADPGSADRGEGATASSFGAIFTKTRSLRKGNKIVYKCFKPLKWHKNV